MSSTWATTSTRRLRTECSSRTRCGRLRPFPSGKAVPQDVEDYRHLYKVYRSDVNQQAVHERFSYILLWDDHEFANDCHQDFPSGITTSPRTRQRQGQPALRQAANRAWSEYGLADTPFRPDGEELGDVGAGVPDVFVRNTGGADGDGRTAVPGWAAVAGQTRGGERYFSLGCGAMSDPARTMLGETQRGMVPGPADDDRRDVEAVGE